MQLYRGRTNSVWDACPDNQVSRNYDTYFIPHNIEDDKAKKKSNS